MSQLNVPCDVILTLQRVVDTESLMGTLGNKLNRRTVTCHG